MKTLLRNWWVIAFISMVWAVYVQAIHRKNRDLAILKEKVERLTLAKERALEEKEELLLRMEAGEDPEWLELVLKEKLGVVAEKERKVVFE